MKKLYKEILKCNMCEKEIIDEKTVKRLKRERHTWNLDDSNAIVPCPMDCNGELVIVKV